MFRDIEHRQPGAPRDDLGELGKESRVCHRGLTIDLARLTQTPEETRFGIEVPKRTTARSKVLDRESQCPRDLHERLRLRARGASLPLADRGRADVEFLGERRPRDLPQLAGDLKPLRIEDARDRAGVGRAHVRHSHCWYLSPNSTAMANVADMAVGSLTLAVWRGWHGASACQLLLSSIRATSFASLDTLQEVLHRVGTDCSRSGSCAPINVVI